MFQLGRTDSVKAVGKAVGVAEWGPVRAADQAWRMRVGFRDLDGSRALVLWMVWGVHVLGILGAAVGPGCARRGWGVGWEEHGGGQGEERGGGRGGAPAVKQCSFRHPAWLHLGRGLILSAPLTTWGAWVLTLEGSRLGGPGLPRGVRRGPRASGTHVPSAGQGLAG